MWFTVKPLPSVRLVRWPTKSWAAIWLEHPEVRVRIGSSLYELLAVHVTDPAERGPILESRGYDPIPDGSR